MFPLPVARSPIGCRLERRGRSHEKTSLQRMVEVGKKTELGPEERTPERTRPSGAEKPGGRGRGLGGNSRPPSAPIATMARSGRWAMPQDSRDTGVRGVSGPSDPDEEPFGRAPPQGPLAFLHGRDERGRVGQKGGLALRDQQGSRLQLAATIPDTSRGGHGPARDRDRRSRRDLLLESFKG